LEFDLSVTPDSKLKVLSMKLCRRLEFDSKQIELPII